MQFLTIATLTASLAAALPAEAVPAATNILGTIFSEEDYGGTYLEIKVTTCVNLSPPLRNSVGSIQITPGRECKVYSARNCVGLKGTYDEDATPLENEDIESVKCGTVQR